MELLVLDVCTVISVCLLFRSLLASSFSTSPGASMLLLLPPYSSAGGSSAGGASAPARSFGVCRPSAGITGEEEREHKEEDPEQRNPSLR